MSADIFLISTDISFSFGFPRSPCSAAPFPRYFKWWLCFQNELKEAAVAQEAEPHWLHNLFHFITLYLSPPLSLDELGGGVVVGGVLLACVRALIGGGSSGAVIFIISPGKITFLKSI